MVSCWFPWNRKSWPQYIFKFIHEWRGVVIKKLFIDEKRVWNWPDNLETVLSRANICYNFQLAHRKLQIGRSASVCVIFSLLQEDWMIFVFFFLSGRMSACWPNSPWKNVPFRRSVRAHFQAHFQAMEKQSHGKFSEKIASSFSNSFELYF